MKTVNSRETYDIDSLVKLVKTDLREFDISERVIETILKSYFTVKRKIIMDGHFVRERGLMNSGISVRRVPTNFSNTGYTVKMVDYLDNQVKDGILDDLKTSEVLQERLGFTPDEK